MQPARRTRGEVNREDPVQERDGALDEGPELGGGEPGRRARRGRSDRRRGRAARRPGCRPGDRRRGPAADAGHGQRAHPHRAEHVPRPLSGAAARGPDAVRVSAHRGQPAGRRDDPSSDAAGRDRVAQDRRHLGARRRDRGAAPGARPARRRVRRLRADRHAGEHLGPRDQPAVLRDDPVPRGDAARAAQGEVPAGPADRAGRVHGLLRCGGRPVPRERQRAAALRGGAVRSAARDRGLARARRRVLQAGSTRRCTSTCSRPASSA